MKKEFIPYEQALALKELGFDEPCFGYYTGDTMHFVLRPLMLRANELESYVVTAPTFSQVFRWFREKCSLHTVINVGIPHDNIAHSKKIQYFFNVVKCGKHHKSLFRSIFYTTYEEAELECLKKLIEIVKTWKK